MAVAFGHAFAAIAFGSPFAKSLKTWKFLVLGIVCSIIPDADVVSFKLGIAYEDFWGHHRFTHSLLFALIFGIIVTLLFYRRHLLSKSGLALILFFSLCTASHAVLDAMTSVGLGVAFFSPWDNTRYFFPWRPIQVSQIEAENFFSKWGIRVLKSEAIWIGIPGVIYMTINWLIKRLKR